MAAIKGQPSPKPQNVPSPIPQTAPSFEEFLAQESGGPQPSFDEFATGEAPAFEEAAPSQGLGEFPGRGVVEAVSPYLPTAGAVVGGLVGAPTGLAGAVGGAALGGAAGESYRQLIETHILGKKPLTPGQAGFEIAKEGAFEGAGQLIGAGIAKAGGKLAATSAGQKVLEAAGKLAEAPLNYVKTSVQAVRDRIEEPITKLLASKASQLTTEQAGDTAKDLLKQNIATRYGPFIKAYESLDTVSKAMPLKDEVRRKFTMGLKEWGASDLAGDNWNVVRKFSDDFDAASSGKQFESVIGQIGDAKRLAFKNGATDQYKVLKDLEGRALNFMDAETTKLAARIQAGKASPEEMGFLTQLAGQQGITEPDPSKYAKSLAKDYLSAKEKIKSDYAGFRSFLEEVGEQTRVKAQQRGPMMFLENINDVPSEKLIERMFDPKNAAALRKMRDETPEVFDTVVSSKVSQILQKSSPNGVLDLHSFRKQLTQLPDSTRSFLFSPQEMKELSKVVDNPRLETLKRLEGKAASTMMGLFADLTELARIGGGKLASGAAKAANSTPGRQLMGNQAVGSGNALYEAYRGAPPVPMQDTEDYE